MTISPRSSDIHRQTAETEVRVRLDLDGAGAAEISTGVGFLDHMLTLFARHGRFDLTVEGRGDTQVDDHHTTEDVGIVLGQAVRSALGDKRGVARYGWAYVPMDEALVRCSLDLSGRPFCVYQVPMGSSRIGTFDTELVEHFCQSLAFHALLTLHVDRIRGENTHHLLEAVFKSMAVALHAASRVVRDDLPSTKGTL
ncbi:MAG: imidazoleglycerol-phosphate dehydratase HisB [Chloroflexota bacterium]|nr:imidazoleglycerol-phosphate dehydratase HisB [Chloroflexota bacterium]